MADFGYTRVRRIPFLARRIFLYQRFQQHNVTREAVVVFELARSLTREVQKTKVRIAKHFCMTGSSSTVHFLTLGRKPPCRACAVASNSNSMGQAFIVIVVVPCSLLLRSARKLCIRVDLTFLLCVIDEVMR
jgi:hypothetical protein